MKKILYSTFITILTLFIFPSTSYASNWTWFYSTDTVCCYIDDDSISIYKDTLLGNIASSWVKKVYNSEGVQEEIADRNKFNFPTNGYEYLDKSVSRVEFYTKNSNKYMRILGSTYYDVNGDILDSWYNQHSDWFLVVPDTIGYRMCQSTYDLLNAKYQTRKEK